MKIDTRLYELGFEIEYLPAWPCPECKVGNLHAPENGIKTFEYPSSHKQKDEYAFEPNWILGNFVGILNCSNQKCKCTAVIAGEMFYDGVPEDVPGYPNEHQMVDKEHIAIRYFNPPLEIINIPDYVTDANTISCLKESFKSFWNDSASCASKIRNVVAAIMDEQKIPGTTRNKKGEEVHVHLHTRLEQFEKIHPEIAEDLIATKWIGNEGTHELDSLSRKQVLLAYEILHQCLDKLYNPRPAEIKKIVKEINKNKGTKKK